MPETANRGKFGLVTFATEAAFYKISTMPNRDFILPPLYEDPPPSLPIPHPKPDEKEPELPDGNKPDKGKEDKEKEETLTDCAERKNKK